MPSRSKPQQCFEPTYKELKQLKILIILVWDFKRFEPTYKELKPQEIIDVIGASYLFWAYL